MEQILHDGGHSRILGEVARRPIDGWAVAGPLDAREPGPGHVRGFEQLHMALQLRSVRREKSRLAEDIGVLEGGALRDGARRRQGESGDRHPGGDDGQSGDAPEHEHHQAVFQLELANRSGVRRR